MSNAKFETMRREEMLSAIFVLRFLRAEPRTYCMGALINCKSTILLISWCHIRTLRMLPYSLYFPVLACTFSQVNAAPNYLAFSLYIFSFYPYLFKSLF